MNPENILWFVQLILNSLMLIIVSGMISIENSPKPGKNTVKYGLFSMGIGYCLFTSTLFY